MTMTLTDFKDLTAGLQSLAIVVATLLGGSWALFQFFSLRAFEKARLELEKTRRALVERSVLVIELATESFDINGSYFLHVRVVIRNIGSGFDIVDWTKASMSARRFHKVDDVTLAASDQVLLAWRAPSMELREMRFMPGFYTSESFLIAIPQVGVYYIDFSMLVSSTVRAETIEAVKTRGATVDAQDVVIWRADKFVSVPQAQPNNAFQPMRG